MTHYQTGVLNQFKFDGVKGATACVALCVQAVYQLHMLLRDHDQLPTKTEWDSIMYRGIRTWQLWRERNPYTATSFPLVDEIIKMPECKGFYEVFNTKYDEIGGLLFDSKVIENTEGPLSRVVTSLLKATKESCALIVLPQNYCIALLRYNNSLFLFDPHGRRGSNEIDFVQFKSPEALVSYLKDEHQYINIDDAYIPKKMSKFDICKQFNYDATVFTTK